MLRRLLFPLACATLLPLALAGLTGCGDDGGTGGSGGTPSTGGGGPGGAGGSGGGAGGGGNPEGHVLLSELALDPAAGELVEIWNPTSAAIDLSDHYLSDNSIYHGIAAGMAWNPAGTPGLDFLVRFPPGTTIAPDAVLVLATDPGFEATYQRCPDFALTTAAVPCGAGTVPAMVAPDNGALGVTSGELLTDAAEMLMLFTWSGVAGEPVQDVDYLIWGDVFGDSERADKTGIEGYQADTPKDMQRPATAPAGGDSVERCALETGETATGGNGVDGHDETSEQLDQSFSVTTAPSPGLKNACLP